MAGNKDGHSSGGGGDAPACGTPAPQGGKETSGPIKATEEDAEKSQNHLNKIRLSLLLATLISLALSYLVVIVVTQLAAAGSCAACVTDIMVFGVEAYVADSIIGGLLAVLVVYMMTSAITYGIYFPLLRKLLLERRRLRFLARHSVYGGPFALVLVVAVASLAGAVGLLGLYVNSQPVSIAGIVVVHLLVMIVASGLSILALHLIDYGGLARLLQGIPIFSLRPTLQWTVRTQGSRLDSLDRHWEEKGLGKRGFDDLTDREQPPEAIQEILTGLREHVEDLRDEKGIEIFLRHHGNVVALFHPDYLPHLSHTYLKLSQLRALNMPPRRIQLLARRWTLRGLESEYVVVHDVSDIRFEYEEAPRPIVRKEEEAKEEAAAECAGAGGGGAALGGGAEAGATESPSGDDGRGSAQQEQPRQPKWRARSLKKRAQVTVAPDGSLIEIDIYEERQFNI